MGECLPMCVEAEEGKESLHPLTHPPTFSSCFGPFFFFDLLFLWLVSTELFSNKTGGKKAHGDGEAALCRLNGAIVRHGGGEGNGS